ncbi:MAG TPA: cbb3-type cytochrome c oxidase subunit I [Oscillospiraceae bacterium]|nr:cbb3-type cytochrome c oxidase subunit I [Oscillospiraceae bacterium]
MKLVKLLSKLVARLRPQRDSEATEEEKLYCSQVAAIPYFLAPLVFLALQSLTATFGALDLVVPDLPIPINLETGRAFHLNLSILWPLLGCMGASYYFLVEETKRELHSLRLVTLQFWIFVLTTIGILTSLMFGYLRGMEYEEAAFPFHVSIAVTLAIFFYNVLRSYLKAPKYRGRMTLLAIVSGSVFLLLLYVPNIINYNQPTVSELVRYWVIHLWEELSKELILFGVLAAFLLKVSSLERKRLERILFVQITLLIIGATFATGHHYYWIGLPTLWQWVGGIFSGVQIISISLLLYILYLGLTHLNWIDLDLGLKLTFGFIIASVCYHIMGAASLGMVIALPQINRYSSATYLTSAHAHFALYGALGMMVLAISTYVLTRKAELTRKEYLLSWWGFGLNNLGLLTMGAALTIAGVLQTYLQRVAGIDFMATIAFLRSYLFIRTLGGACFAAGALLYAKQILWCYWRNRHYFN